MKGKQSTWLVLEDFLLGVARVLHALSAKTWP